MIANRELTPEEKAKHREWQTAELLRRRGIAGPPFVEPGAVAEPEAKAAPKCPRCGTPYVNPKYRRCFTCHPGAGRVRTRPVVPTDAKPPPRRVGLEEAFARPKGPVVEAEIEAPEPVPDTPAPSASPDPIAVLRRVVDAVAGLDATTARWVLRSAAGMPRGD